MSIENQTWKKPVCLLFIGCRCLHVHVNWVCLTHASLRLYRYVDKMVRRLSNIQSGSSTYYSVGSLIRTTHMKMSGMFFWDCDVDVWLLFWVTVIQIRCNQFINQRSHCPCNLYGSPAGVYLRSSRRSLTKLFALVKTLEALDIPYLSFCMVWLYHHYNNI